MSNAPKATNMFFASSLKEGETQKGDEYIKVYLDADNLERIVNSASEVNGGNDNGGVITVCISRKGKYPSAYGFVDAKQPRPDAGNSRGNASKGRASAAAYRSKKLG